MGKCDPPCRRLKSQHHHLSTFSMRDPPCRRLKSKGFHYLFMYPLNKLGDTVIKRGVPTCHQLRFIFSHYRFVSIQFRNFIELHEGSACCADKSGTIIRAIIRFYMTGEPITFDYSQKYTFHLPTKVLTTHDEIIGFFTAVYSLYYGRPADFIARYKERS